MKNPETFVHLMTALKTSIAEEERRGDNSMLANNISRVIKQYFGNSRTGLNEEVDRILNRIDKKYAKSAGAREFFDPNQSAPKTQTSPLGQNVVGDTEPESTIDVDAKRAELIAMTTEEILADGGNIEFIKEDAIESGFSIDLTLSPELIVTAYVNAVSKALLMTKASEGPTDNVTSGKEIIEEEKTSTSTVQEDEELDESLQQSLEDLTAGTKPDGGQDNATVQ